MTSPIPAADSQPTDLFSLLEAEARAVAAAFGVPTASELAAALVDRMHHRVAGGQVYVAKRSKARRQEAREAMLRDFDGFNLREVAKRHGYTARHARRIIEEK